MSERLVNSPPQLAPPLQQALFDEIAWATEDEPTAELRASFQLQRYVALSRAYCDPAAARPRGKRAKGEEVRAPPSGDGAAVRPAVSARGGRGRARPSARPSAQEPVVVYARPEDEFYHRHCTWSYTFPVTSRPLRKDELQPLRLVMLLSPEQVAAARWPPKLAQLFASLASRLADFVAASAPLTSALAAHRKELDAAVGNAAA